MIDLANSISNVQELEEIYEKKYKLIYNYKDNRDLCEILLQKFYSFQKQINWNKKNQKRLTDL
jgi:hypothetical protein